MLCELHVLKCYHDKFTHFRNNISHIHDIQIVWYKLIHTIYKLKMSFRFCYPFASKRTHPHTYKDEHIKISALKMDSCLPILFSICLILFISLAIFTPPTHFLVCWRSWSCAKKKIVCVHVHGILTRAQFSVLSSHSSSVSTMFKWKYLCSTCCKCHVVCRFHCLSRRWHVSRQKYCTKISYVWWKSSHMYTLNNIDSFQTSPENSHRLCDEHNVLDTDFIVQPALVLAHWASSEPSFQRFTSN